MAWRIKDGESDQSPQKGWRLKQEEPSFDIGRALGAGAIGFGRGLTETGSEFFGSEFGKKRQRQETEEYPLRFNLLKEQGLSDEEIYRTIGEPPEKEFDIDEATGGRFIPKTPEEEQVQAMGREAGNFLAFGLFPGGGSLAKEAASGALFGYGSELAKQEGAGPIGQIAAGMATASIPGMLKAGASGLSKMYSSFKSVLGKQAMPEEVAFLAQKGSPKALADLELSSKDLVGRTAKISDETLNSIRSQAQDISRPAMEELKQFRAADIESSILKENQKALLDRISPAAETQKANWEGIQKYVESNFEAMKEGYSRLYEQVEKSAQKLPVSPSMTQKVASSIYNDLEKSLIKVPEESGVKTALQQVVNTLKPMAEGNIVEIPVVNLMSAKRSINRLLSKSDIIPAPVDLLKPVGNAMKQDIMNALSARPSLKTMYENAESLFAKTQEVFNNDIIAKMRRSEMPEKLSSEFAQPSALKKLKAAIGKENNVEDLVERLVVENISNKSLDNAKFFANEVKPFISEKANKALSNLLEYGNKLTSKGQQAITRGNILSDVQNLATTGTRPEYTLKLMRSSKLGRELVNDALKRSKSGREILKELHKITVEDLLKSITDSQGRIDFSKTKDLLKEPEIKNVLKDALGQKGLDLFQKLETYGKNMEENIRILSAKDPTLLQRVLDKSYSTTAKGLIVALTGMKAGIPALLGIESLRFIKQKRLMQILTDPQAVKAIEKLGSKNLNKFNTAKALENFAKAANRFKDEEE